MFVIVVLIHFITILVTVNLQQTIKITIHPVPSSNASPDNHFNFGEVPPGNDRIPPPPDGRSYIRRLEDELLYQKLHQPYMASNDFVDFGRPRPRPLSIDDHHHDRHHLHPQGNEDFFDFGKHRGPRDEQPGRPFDTATIDDFGKPRPPPPGDERPEARVIADDNSPPRSLSTADFDETGTSRRLSDDKNRFNFNPTIPPSSPNKYNFNPNGGSKKRGPNPAEVYKENPFFQNITRAQNQAKANRAAFSLPSQPQPVQTMTYTPDPFISFSDDLDDLPPEMDLVSKDSSQPTRPFDDVCGLSITANHLIYNGHVVPKGAYPWLVAMFYVKRTGLNYICSGSLISNKHVVTAAHCVDSKKPSDLILIFGKVNIQRWIPASGEKIVEPTAIHIHPDYESLTSDADIAVLVLSEALKFTQYIRPVCLWRGTSDLDNVVGHSGTVIGWGKNEQGLLMTEEPKQTNLPVVSQEKCLASNYQFHYITSNRTFCAGFRNGSGPCNGDSGGGFIMKVDGKWILRGIVSLSISETVTKSCDLSNYVVFCDASKFTNWLLSFFK